jgi:hypothetical protein
VRRALLVGVVVLTCGSAGAAAQSQQSGVAAAHLYWVDTGSGLPSGGAAVERSNLNGTGRKLLANPSEALYLAVSSSHLFWSANSQNGQMCTEAGIVKANLDGGGFKAIVDSRSAHFNGVAVGGDHLYSANQCAGTIVESNLNGRPIKTIAKHQTPFGVAAGSSHLYWTNRGAIVEAKLNGTDAKTIAKAGPAIVVSDVAVGGGHLYWSGFTAHFTGRIVEAGLGGAGARTIVTVPGGTVTGVAVGGGHLYWSDGSQGTIVEANLNGTNAKTIATHQDGPVGLAVGP